MPLQRSNKFLMPIPKSRAKRKWLVRIWSVFIDNFVVTILGSGDRFVNGCLEGSPCLPSKHGRRVPRWPCYLPRKPFDCAAQRQLYLCRYKYVLGRDVRGLNFRSEAGVTALATIAAEGTWIVLQEARFVQKNTSEDHLILAKYVCHTCHSLNNVLLFSLFYYPPWMAVAYSCRR
jgi:hypothetical protein